MSPTLKYPDPDTGEWLSLASAVKGDPGPEGPQGPQGPPGTAYLNAQWNFNQNTVTSPNSGTMRMDSTSYATAGQLYVHETDRDGLNRSSGLDLAQVGDQIIMQSAQGRAVWTITLAADSGTWRTFNVTLVESSGTRPSASSPTTLYFSSVGGETGSLQTRTTATITTASLAADETEMGTVTLAPGYRLLRVATSAAARVRLYASTAARTGDLSRPIGSDPVGDHGVMLEMVTTSGDLDWGLSPTVDGYLDTGSDVPYAVTNLSGSTTAVVVTLTWLATEGV